LALGTQSLANAPLIILIRLFKPKLSDCMTVAKFLATPLLGAIGFLQDLDWIPRPTTCLHNLYLENAGQAQFKFSH